MERQWKIDKPRFNEEAEKTENANDEDLNEVALNGEENEKYLPRISASDTKHMKVYEKVMSYYKAFSVLFGCEVHYGWVPGKRIMHYVTHILLYSAWFAIFYTIYVHYTNGNYKRFMEPLAILGYTCSVNTTLFGACNGNTR